VAVGEGDGLREDMMVSEQAVMQQVQNAALQRVSPPGRLVVTVAKQLGAVGERVEVLPSLSGIVVMLYEHGCQVWLRPVDVQGWITRCGG
jgi:hypothetical protein